MSANYRQALLMMASLLAAPVAATAAENVVRKCQDPQGHWYYGHYRAPECGRTVVYQLDEEAREIGHEDPPPTKQELAQAVALEAERQRNAAQRREDQALLQLYNSIDLIHSTRDRKLNSLLLKVQTAEQLRSGLEKDLAELHTREQTDDIRAEIERREQLVVGHSRVIEESNQEYERVVEEYREIEQQYTAASERLRRGGN